MKPETWKHSSLFAGADDADRRAGGCDRPAQEAFRLPQRNGLQGRELVEAARACEIRFAYTIAGRFRSVKLPDEPAAGGLLQPREAAGVKALRQRLFRAPQDGGKHGIGPSSRAAGLQQRRARHLREAGGNETKIPKKFDDVLYPYGWREIRISGDLHIKFYPRQADQRGRFSSVPFEERVTENYIDGHNIDFLKGRIAFDLEWNSKDQTFDRDLLAMRTYYDCDIVSAGIIVTRSQDLNDVFKTVYDYDKNSSTWKPIMRKYGASTTWMGKLLYRLESRRNGGCPVLAIGIKKTCVSDWKEGYIDEHASGNI